MSFPDHLSEHHSVRRDPPPARSARTVQPVTRRGETEPGTEIRIIVNRLLYNGRAAPAGESGRARAVDVEVRELSLLRFIVVCVSEFEKM